MDVHRSRFVPYPTSAISALAFSRSSDSGYTGTLPSLKLAIGRANGDIEIWDPLKGSWVQEAIFQGDGRSVDGLAWTQDPDETDSEGHVILGQQRLFSIASSPAVLEWDLATGQVKRRSTGSFSEVWCFAAQPRWRPHKGSNDEPRTQDIVAGCGDGTLVLLSTADYDLQFRRFLARVSGKKARCMCVTYQHRDIIVAGFADSVIRIFDSRSGSLLRNMSLGAGIPGAPKNALVWQVKCLPNGDIVSGDSNGEVRFWEGRTYSLLQRIIGHDTDCLDLVTSTDGRTVFSGSIDGRVAVYRQSSNEGRRKTWAKTSHRRQHLGEVKAMATFDSKGISVVVSGGNDIAPIVAPLREYGKEHHRTLPAIPQDSPVVSAPKARLLVSWWEKTISIWRLARHGAVDEPEELQKPCKLVARMALATKDKIRCVSMTADGKLLAASTSSDVKIFQFRKRPDSNSLAIRKLGVFQDLADCGARVLSFSPDGKWLAAVSPANEVHIVRLTTVPEYPKRMQAVNKVVELERRHRKLTYQTGFKDYDRTIIRLAFAADSSVLVVGDLSGFLDSWVLEGHEDITAPAIDIAKHDSGKASSNAGCDSDSDSDSSDDEDEIAIFYGQHWTHNTAGRTLPKLDSAPLLLTFRPQHSSSIDVMNGNPGVHATRYNPHAHSHQLPQGQHRMFVMTARHEMYEFDVMAGKLSDWSRRNPSAVLPEEFQKIKDRAVGAVWDVSEHTERIWLYGNSWVFMLNVGFDLVDRAHLTLSNKRRRRGSEPEPIKKYKSASGAGSKIPNSQRESAPDSVRKYENGQWSHVDVSLQVQRDAAAYGEEDEDMPGLQLARSERDGSAAEVHKADTEGQTRRWSTFKYRPILGMVPLEGIEGREANRPLEVVIVERPLLDSKARKISEVSPASLGHAQPRKNSGVRSRRVQHHHEMIPFHAARSDDAVTSDTSNGEGVPALNGPSHSASQASSWTPRLILFSFWAVAVFLGLPQWIWTTSIPRAKLPNGLMNGWADGQACQLRYPLAVELDGSALPTEQLQMLSYKLNELLKPPAGDAVQSYHVFVNGSDRNATQAVTLPRSDFGALESALVVRLAEDASVDILEASLTSWTTVLDIRYSPELAVEIDAFASSVARQVVQVFQDETASMEYLLRGSPYATSHEASSLTPEHEARLGTRTTRAFKYASMYHLTFSLFTSGPSPSSWAIEEALQEYIQPLVGRLSALTRFTIDTQVQLYASFSPSIAGPQYDAPSAAWLLQQSDLSGFVNAAEWPLSPSIGSGPTINFVLYAPAKDQSPLQVAETGGHSWLIPQWGGVQILNSTGEQADDLTFEDLQPTMLTFADQLMSLLGVPPSPPSLSLRINSLTRERTISLILSASSTLGALVRLTRKLESIAIPDSVAKSVDETIHRLDQACLDLREGRFQSALENARTANDEAEQAFFEPSMVGQVYFPEEHKVAVYVPLLGPMAVPLVISAIKELRSLRKRKQKTA